MSIYERLREVRTKLGLSQTEASTKFCIGLSSYKKYEAGSSEPGSTALAGISNAGVNTNWLLTGKGPMLMADYSTNPSEREIKPVEREITPQEAITASSVDVNRLKLAIEQIEQELVKRRGMLEPAAKARVFVLAYQVLEDEDKEKDRASFEYAQKMITKLMKTVL